MKIAALKISPALFGIAVIAFFMPFVNVTCAGPSLSDLSASRDYKVVGLTGFQLVTGTSLGLPHIPQEVGEKLGNGRIGAEPLAVATFALAFIGGLLSLSFKRSLAIAPAVAAGAGTVCLLLLKSKIDGDMLRYGRGMLEARYEAGFWLILAGLVLALVASAFAFAGHDEDGRPKPARRFRDPESSAEEEW